MPESQSPGADAASYCGDAHPGAHPGGRIALVSMPWHNPFIPSIQLGALKAYVEREAAEWTVDTFHYYLEMEEIIGLKAARQISEQSFMGEAVFASLLFPQKRDDILLFLEEEKSGNPELAHIDFAADVIEPMSMAAQRRAASVDWSQYGCIGFSLVFGQTMASMLMAKLIKQRAPDSLIVAGGPSCTGEVGAGLLRLFPQLDLVVNGEGELPLIQLIRQLETGPPHPEDIAAILSRESPRGRLMMLNQLRDLDDLPTPNYASYFATADALVTRRIIYGNVALPVESSRGCWWDRSAHDPMRSCSFCNLNLHWNGYREKSVKKFADELRSLARGHGVRDILLVDNILRHSEVEALCTEILALGQDLRIGIEARVSVKPAEMVALRKAGVVYIQFGIEALSTAILKLIYKGTSCIQNIQAMKFCDRFGIENISNLITYHPGVGVDALLETLRNIELVSCFRPLSCSRFTLSYQSPIYKNPSAFGVNNVRNLETLNRCFPDEVCERLFWLDKSFDVDSPPEVTRLWQEVQSAVGRWKQLFDGQTSRYRVPSLLLYEDTGERLAITDYRTTPPRLLRLDRDARAIYLACEEARTIPQIQNCCPELPEPEIAERLDDLVQQRVVFHEARQYLSLAIPADPVRRLSYGTHEDRSRQPHAILS
jgi:ribosomal peptide maturation radical SAM protein 1